eukprot:4993910-Lingulodinium_polyedra.AAC.1
MRWSRRRCVLEQGSVPGTAVVRAGPRPPADGTVDDVASAAPDGAAVDLPWTAMRTRRLAPAAVPRKPAGLPWRAVWRPPR